MGEGGVGTARSIKWTPAGTSMGRGCKARVSFTVFFFFNCSFPTATEVLSGWGQ